MLRFAETLWKDMRYAVRMLLRSPAFTLVAMLSLALGIGANTALFSVMDALILRMLPVKNAEQLIRLRAPLSFPTYEKIRDQSKTTSGIFAYNGLLFSVSAGQEAEQATGFMASGNYYSILGVKTAAGRLLSANDDRVPGVGGAPGCPGRSGSGAAARINVFGRRLSAFWSRRPKSARCMAFPSSDLTRSIS